MPASTRTRRAGSTRSARTGSSSIRLARRRSTTGRRRVDADGTVWVGGRGITEVFQIWKLAEGASGWTKTGALTTTMLGADAAAIEGGFQLDSIVGAFAPDGSVHLWSSARCINTGDRNKLQLYMRSQDGVSWSVERLPDMTALLDGHVTWSNNQVWASSYDNARFVNVSSTKPIMQGLDWIYPSRQLNVIARCTSGGQPAFERLATAPLPGWTVRGFSRFSDTGALTLLTSLGLTQIYVHRADRTGPRIEATGVAMLGADAGVLRRAVTGVDAWRRARSHQRQVSTSVGKAAHAHAGAREDRRSRGARAASTGTRGRWIVRCTARPG